MKYIRQRKNGKWQFRQGDVAFTSRNLTEVITFRNNTLGNDPDLDVPVPKQQNINETRFAAIGDTHLASKYEQLDALHQFYETLKAEGIKLVLHAGNWVEGEAKFNRYETTVVGMDAQLAYFMKNYPKGITTRIISGDDHEGWWQKDSGIDVSDYATGVALKHGRSDLVFDGHMEANYTIAGKRVRVVHAGGGSARSVSLKGQNIVDTYEDDEKPDILLVGHYHKAHYLPNYRQVTVIQVGTFQLQTSFMRKIPLRADIGGWIVDLSNGRQKVEFLQYKKPEWRYAGQQ